ncbi:MAG: [FeFe] hydrogenase H-cluster radical SAM maturase HydE [Eggerthellaceae bacterium]
MGVSSIKANGNAGHAVAANQLQAEGSRAPLSSLVEKLACEHALSLKEYERLIAERTDESALDLRKRAVAARREIYGTDVFVRGLIEFTNVCRNDCYYCGIRAGNASCDRYRLSSEQIFSCADEGYRHGFRTFVLQGGEDPIQTDERLCALVAGLKERHPDCAVTLSVGERSRESYERLFAAGADRYLLRHETADPAHYAKLHPQEMSFENRMRCLRDLKDIGFAAGCGFMVGTPYQTPAHLAKDLKFVEAFQPDMCGIGPFIPHEATPFAHEPAGSGDLTCYLLSIIRLIHPTVLLPATTALGTLWADGYERGILSGANVIMPNLTPPEGRRRYRLYNGKQVGDESLADRKTRLALQMEAIGYHIVVGRGDPRRKKQA